ncbi:MAG: hypothetical protein LBO09_00580 [Candidatus Peribacteria bacterium]|jgi:hypothetical protein|nr:hypothetical protein [Candidatus Peribacteria bacterium]
MKKSWKVCLSLLVVVAGMLFTSCEKEEYHYTTIIVQPGSDPAGDGNGDNNGNNNGTNSDDVYFIVDGKSVKEITIYQDILLELVPAKKADGFFTVWYYWAPEGIRWTPPTSGQYSGRYINYVVHQKGLDDTFYAQYYDRITGQELSKKVALIIHHR